MPYAYSSHREKVVHFWLGFAGWFVGNGVAAAILLLLGPTGQPLSGLLVLLLNIAALIALASIRQPAALGLLLAFANLLALVVIVGIFETPADFTAGLGTPAASPAPFIGFGLLGIAAFAIGSFFAMRAILRGL